MAETGNTIQQFNIKATADVQSAISKLEALKTTMQSVDKNMSMTGATQSLKQFESELSTMARDIKSRTQELAKSMTPNELRQALKQSTRTMNSAQSQMTAYADSQGQMWRNAKVDITKAGIQAEVYRKQLEKTTNLAGKMKVFGASDEKPIPKIKWENRDWLDRLKENGYYTPDVDTLKNKTQFIDTPKDYTKEVDNFTKKAEYVAPTVEHITTKMGTLRFGIRKAFSSLSLEKFSNAMNTVGEKSGVISEKLGGVVGFVGNMGKKFLSAINPMRLFNKEQSKTALASSFLGKAFSRLARMFRIMVTRMLIRAFITNIREGFQNIAQYSEEVNRAFSRIGASAKTLYNSVASAFAPLIQAIAPYIVKALDMITSAFNKVAELISAITGKSYYIKATKYNYDYAKSLDKSTKSTNKNTKATNKNKKAKKDLKNETIGIDRLNVIAPDKDKTNSGNNGSGAGNNGGANVNDMFDTKPISKKMKNLAKEIRKIAKKLFKPIRSAWNKEGKYVFKSWKSALKSVWKTIKTIGKDFLEVWGQKKTQKIFENIFSIFGDIGQVVKNLSDNFRKAWKHNNTGKKILEKIRNVVYNISKGFKNMSSYTVKWSKTVDFKPLLTSIEGLADALDDFSKNGMKILGDFYKNFLLPIYKWTIGKGLPKLIDIISQMEKKLNWKTITKNLKDFWVAIEPFAENFGEGLLDFLKDFSNVPVDIINSLFGDNGAVKGITETLNETDPQVAKDWGYAFGQLATALLLFKGLKKVAPIIATIGTKIKKLASALEFLGRTNPAGFEMAVINGAEAIDKTFKSLFPRIYEYLMDFSNDVNLYVNTFLALLKNIFVDFVKTIGNLIMTPFKLIGDALKEVAKIPGFEWLLPTAQQFDFAYNKVRSFKELVKDSQREAQADYISSVGGFKAESEDAKYLFAKGKPKKADIKKYANLTPEELKAFKEQFKKYKISVSDFFDTSAEKKLKKNAEKWGIELPKSLLKGLKTGRVSIPKTAEELKRQIKFDKALKKSKIAGKDVIRSIWDGVKSGKIDVQDAVKYEKLLKKAKDKGLEIPKNLSSGIKGNKKTVQDAIGKLQNVINGVKGKTATIKAEKSKNFDKNVENASNKIKSSIPSTKEIEIRAKLNINSFTKVGKESGKIAKMISKGYSLKRRSKGTDGHTYGYFEKDGKTKRVRLYASGGYVNMGTEFIAGEKGAEMVGTINGKTGVASNQEITGIRDSIEESSNAQNQILAEQNKLLRALLEKNTDIVLDGEKVTKRVNKINARSGYRMAT